MNQFYTKEIFDKNLQYAYAWNTRESHLDKTFLINFDAFNVFHTDRGNEFKNKLIDEVIKTFHIKRSLSKKGCPYDNAVAEATYKIFKTEFAFNRRFANLEELERELFDYVNWYNNVRIHGSLNSQTPVAYRLGLFL